MNKSGKTFIIFGVLIIILLVSSTSIGFFLYSKERQLRHSVEDERDIALANETKLQADLKEINRQLVILQDKNKEADEKINNLLDEIELNDGLREELKKENVALKQEVESTRKDKEKARFDLDATANKIKELERQVIDEKARREELEEEVKNINQAKKDLENEFNRLKELNPTLGQASASGPESQNAVSLTSVELDKIVVNPQDGVKGRVLSVDKETEFIVCNLGIKQGVQFGDVLSVYRGEEYLGDVKVSRVQDEMSAADLIPPFSSRRVRKNDIVVIKP